MRESFPTDEGTFSTKQSATQEKGKACREDSSFSGIGNYNQIQKRESLNTSFFGQAGSLQVHFIRGEDFGDRFHRTNLVVAGDFDSDGRAHRCAEGDDA